MSLHIGLGTMSGQVPETDTRSVGRVYRDLVRLGGIAEQVGFDVVWVSEHHGSPDSHIPAPMIILAAIAAATDRVRLGSGIALAPFQHPIRFAEDCAVVDQLSRGRLVVGVGAGWRDEEFAAFRIHRAERIGRTVELVEICRAAWSGNPVSYAGRFFTVDEVIVTPGPFRPPPLLLAGTVPRAATRAGRIADGFIAGPQRDIAAFRGLLAAFDAGALEAGRDPSALSIGLQFDAWVSDDGSVPEHVLAAMWHKIGTSRLWHAGQEVRGSADLPPIEPAEIRARGFMGTPAEVIAGVRPWVEAFGDRDLHLMFRLQHPGLALDDIEPATRRFGADVIPALRRIAA